MSANFVPQCTVHPGVAAAAPCARCRRPFCAACLVSHQGLPLCVACVAAVAGPQRPALPEQRTDIRGTGRVELSRWLSAGWQLLLAEVGTWLLAALIMLVVSLLTCLITFSPLYCGLFQMALRQIRGERISADQVFWGFRRFGSAFVHALLVALPILPVYLYMLYTAATVLFQEKPDRNEFMQAWFTVLICYGYMFLFGMAIQTATFFSYPRLAAVRTNPFGALADSWRVVRRNFWMFLLSAFVLLLIQGLGASVLYVGYLFTLPLSVLAWAQAYVDHFGLEDAQLD